MHPPNLPIVVVSLVYFVKETLLCRCAHFPQLGKFVIEIISTGYLIIPKELGMGGRGRFCAFGYVCININTIFVFCDEVIFDVTRVYTILLFVPLWSFVKMSK